MFLSFENLRWASAMRDWQAGVEQDDIRQKLGLSKIAWRETKGKLQLLAAPGKEAPLAEVEIKVPSGLSAASLG